MPSLRLMLLLRLSLVTAVDTVVMAATAVATTARGLLMLSPRLMPLLWLSPDMAMAAMAVDTVAMAVDTAMEAMARGLLSPAMAMAATAGATAAMVATDTAGATATGVSYHQIRRSELS